MQTEFLRKLQKLVKQFDTLLIFDEVMTRFGRTGVARKVHISYRINH